MSLARTERAQLADLLDDVGPDAPTLCEGWKTSDLLIHLLTRERRPDAALGAFVAAARPWHDKVVAGWTAKPWRDQVELLRSGPPAANPMGWRGVEGWTNAAELFIHHEDVRRARAGWRPRELSGADTAALARILAAPFARAMLRKVRVGVVAELPDRQPITLRSGLPFARVHGEPGEVLIWASGRDAARVEFSGDEDAIAAVKKPRRGI